MNGDQSLDEQAVRESGVRAGFKQGFQAGYTTAYERSRVKLSSTINDIIVHIKAYEVACRKFVRTKNCSRCDDATFSKIYQIIEKYREEKSDNDDT